ncbi:helix-turn-helix domain-containing protein [Mammaliicoccus sciuri]|uniref:helix-turn-helix domain-containing protein n=1 Tax=Mammaliicoccus sciuri TaxID=1296 RepID=UPI002DB8C7D1|nr:helix-turn-helix transcriptional regulator [Mammaliicoccus sciuri]MEB7065834.1 helix-turn-helix domain-containing protein [Mammaliicoccus sciuri]
MEAVNIDTGQIIKNLRKSKNWSQDQLAETLHVSRQSISKWELNQGYPDIDNLIQLSKIFDVSLEYLLIKNKQIKNEESLSMNREWGTVEIAEQWVQFSNDKNIEALKKVTSEELKVQGPKGENILKLDDIKNWLERANLQLATFERYLKDDKIVMGQHGTWMNPDNTIKGQQNVYTLLIVENKKVKELARSNTKEEAFGVSNINESDKIL